MGIPINHSLMFLTWRLVKPSRMKSRIHRIGPKSMPDQLVQNQCLNIICCLQLISSIACLCYPCNWYNYLFLLLRRVTILLFHV
jgi:hypothetical protein